MSWRSVKKTRLWRELYYVRRAFFYYKKFGTYFKARFIIGPRIFRDKVPIDRNPTESSYSVHMLCSRGDLALLFWSLKSWYAVVPSSGKVYIHEDGTFTAKNKRLIRKLLPYAEIVDRRCSDDLAAREWLKRYPSLRSFRGDKDDVLMIKLIDPYFTGSAPRRLILDTDMLWFGRPDEIVDAMETGHAMPFMMISPQKAFKLCDGTQLSQELSDLNSGIVGYTREDFDLDRLEGFFSKGTPYNHFIEQAAYAYTFGSLPSFRSLDPKRYVIKEDAPGTVVKHFTGPRREEFWFEGVVLLEERERKASKRDL